jgi:DNA-binding PadR family transcriptional regulator
MDTISNKEMALLGLLSEGPMHAYGIEKEIENRSMREWTEISMSSVYKLLNKLEEDGMIGSEARLAPNNVAQRVYAITESGRAALRERIKAFLSDPEHYLHRIDLATSHLDQLSKEEALECLGKYRDKLADGIRCYGELEGYLRSVECPIHSMALARRPRYLLEGEIGWVDEYVAAISAMNEIS